MDQILALEMPSNVGPRREYHRGVAPPMLGKGIGYTLDRRVLKLLAVIGEHDAERGLAQPHRLFQHCVEHRREITGRRIDDLQYLGGRSLLFERLARLGQQPRILHRDDRLSGEVLQQRNLLVGKRPYLLAVDRERPDYGIVLAQRYNQAGTGTANINHSAVHGVFSASISLIVLHVRKVDDTFSMEHSLLSAARARLVRRRCQILDIRSGQSSQSKVVEALAVETHESAKGGLAKPQCFFEHRVEHG